MALERTWSDYLVQDLTLTTNILSESNSTSGKNAIITGQKIINLISAQGYLTQSEIEALTTLTLPVRFFSGGNFTEALFSAWPVSISAAYMRDDNNTYNILLPSGISKNLQAGWSEGTGNGGMDTGTFEYNRLYYIFGIYNPTTFVSDAIFSLSKTSPNLPSGYTSKRIIGGIVIQYNGSTSGVKKYQHYSFDENNNIISTVPNDYFNEYTITKSGVNILFSDILCKDNDNDIDLYNLNSITKTLSSWSEGYNNGILDTGSISDNTAYYLFIINNPSTGAMDFLMSLNSSSPTMPTGYTKKRRIGVLATGDYSGSSVFYVSSHIEKAKVCAHLTGSYNLTYANDDTYEPILGTFENDLVKKFLVTSTPSIKYIGAEPITCKIDINAVLSGDTLNSDVYIAIVKDPSGTPEIFTDYEMYQRIKAVNSPYIFNSTIHVELEQNDEVQINSKSTNAGDVTSFEKLIAFLIEI